MPSDPIASAPATDAAEPPDPEHPYGHAKFEIVAAMAIGYGLGRFTDGARRRSIIIEVGFQNGTFGIVLATTQLDSATAALSPAFYSLVMFATGGTLAWVWSRRSSAPSPAPTSA